LNTACLIGLVACRPRPVGGDGEVGLLLITQRDPAGDRVDRHRVILSPRHTPDLAEFSPGATVYVEGHLARHGERRRVSVIAHRAWPIAPAPPAPEETDDRRPRLPPGAPAGGARAKGGDRDGKGAPCVGATDDGWHRPPQARAQPQEAAPQRHLAETTHSQGRRRPPSTALPPRRLP